MAKNAVAKSWGLYLRDDGTRGSAPSTLNFFPRPLDPADKDVPYSRVVTFTGPFIAPFALTVFPSWMTITAQDATTATVGGTPDVSGDFEIDFADSTP